MTLSLRLSMPAWMLLPSFHSSLFRMAALAAGSAVSADAARADIDGHIDDLGMDGFSTEKVDDRCQRFLQGDQSFDAADPTHDAVAKADDTASETPPVRFSVGHPNQKNMRRFRWRRDMPESGRRSCDPSMT